jgi:hypothetical protein
MDFRFVTNTISHASQKFGTGVFITGMMLIGFGFLIWVLRELFAILFALLFCVAGVGCIITALKIFWTGHKIGKAGRKEQNKEYRQNVKIHIRDNFDQ